MKGLKAGSAAPKGEAKGFECVGGAPNESSGSASLESSTVGAVVFDPEEEAAGVW